MNTTMTIPELEAALAAAREKETKAQEETCRTRAKRRKEIREDQASWTWRAEPVLITHWHTNEKRNGLRVMKRIRDAIIEANPDTFDSIDKLWSCMNYYRTSQNILAHEGSGTHVLAIPQLCSDAEWAAIASGDVPEKFLYRPGFL